jgi:hypothetical protein
MTNGSDLISKIYAMMEKHKEVNENDSLLFLQNIIFVNF